MSDARRKAILEMAARDKELAAEITPVVAAGFGVLPLRRLGDVLTVACCPGANRQALGLLREVLELEIVATPFDFSALYEAIRTAYFSDEESVNFPTFLDEEFLDDPSSVALLREEKVEHPEPVSVELPDTHVALCSMTYRSELINLDSPPRGGGLPDPARTRMELGELQEGWRRIDGQVRVYGEPLAEDVRLVVNEYHLSEHRHLRGGGRISEHEVKSRQIRSLPLIVHPTEVQVTGIEADATLRFHVYDRVQRVVPGHPARIDLAYHFLNYGNRMHRSIQVEVHDLVCVPRDRIVGRPEPDAWGARELARWFGLDATAEG